MSATILMLLLMQTAGAGGPAKNTKTYPFGPDMHRAVYEVSVSESAWQWLPRSIMIASYGAVKGVSLHYDSIIVTKKPWAKWAQIDPVMKTLLRGQAVGGTQLPPPKTYTTGPAGQMLDENGRVAGSWRITNDQQELREAQETIAAAKRRLDWVSADYYSRALIFDGRAGSACGVDCIDKQKAQLYYGYSCVIGENSLPCEDFRQMFLKRYFEVTQQWRVVVGRIQNNCTYDVSPATNLPDCAVWMGVWESNTVYAEPDRGKARATVDPPWGAIGDHGLPNSDLVAALPSPSVKVRPLTETQKEALTDARIGMVRARIEYDKVVAGIKAAFERTPSGGFLTSGSMYKEVELVEDAEIAIVRTKRSPDMGYTVPIIVEPIK